MVVVVVVGGWLHVHLIPLCKVVEVRGVLVVMGWWLRRWVVGVEGY